MGMQQPVGYKVILALPRQLKEINQCYSMSSEVAENVEGSEPEGLY